MMSDDEIKRPTEDELFSWDEEERLSKVEMSGPNRTPEHAAEPRGDLPKSNSKKAQKPRSRKNKNKYRDS